MRLILALPLAIVAFGCDGMTHIDGTVLTPDGEPIPGAAVNFTLAPDRPGDHPPADTATSDEEGRFSVGRVHPPGDTVLLEVSKEGFAPHAETLTESDPYKEVILEPVGQ